MVVGGIVRWVDAPNPRPLGMTQTQYNRQQAKTRLHEFTDDELRDRIGLDKRVTLTNEVRVAIISGEAKTYKDVRRIKEYRRVANKKANGIRSMKRIGLTDNEVDSIRKRMQGKGWSAPSIRHVGERSRTNWVNSAVGGKSYAFDTRLLSELEKLAEEKGSFDPDDFYRVSTEVCKDGFYAPTERSKVRKTRLDQEANYGPGEIPFHVSMMDLLRIRIKSIESGIRNERIKPVCGRCAKAECPCTDCGVGHAH